MNQKFSSPADSYERIPYANPAFPVYALEDRLSNSPGSRVVGHYHADFELVAILEGGEDYFVNGRQIRLEPGDIIFTNSRHFHYACLSRFEDCRFLAVLFHPSLVCEHPWLAERWISRLLASESIDCLHFSSQNSQRDRLAGLIRKAFVCYQNPDADLRLVSVLYDILDLICSVLRDKPQDFDSQALQQFRSMAACALSNPEAGLRQLADAGQVGITRCTGLFHRYTGMSPARYCAMLKLKKAEKLLRTTDLNQTEIALECGYSSSSYFCQCFKKVYGRSPLQYRKDLSR